MLFGLSAHDPMTLAGTALAFVVTAVAAGYFPGRRAASTEPMLALRHE
jgi:putative ABC transport system permease protein